MDRALSARPGAEAEYQSVYSLYKRYLISDKRREKWAPTKVEEDYCMFAKACSHIVQIIHSPKAIESLVTNSGNLASNMPGIWPAPVPEALLLKLLDLGEFINLKDCSIPTFQKMMSPDPFQSEKLFMPLDGVGKEIATTVWGSLQSLTDCLGEQHPGLKMFLHEAAKIRGDFEESLKEMIRILGNICGLGCLNLPCCSYQWQGAPLLMMIYAQSDSFCKDVTSCIFGINHMDLVRRQYPTTDGASSSSLSFVSPQAVRLDPVIPWYAPGLCHANQGDQPVDNKGRVYEKSLAITCQPYLGGKTKGSHKRFLSALRSRNRSQSYSKKQVKFTLLPISNAYMGAGGSQVLSKPTEANDNCSVAVKLEDFSEPVHTEIQREVTDTNDLPEDTTSSVPVKSEDSSEPFNAGIHSEVVADTQDMPEDTAGSVAGQWVGFTLLPISNTRMGVDWSRAFSKPTEANNNCSVAVRLEDFSEPVRTEIQREVADTNNLSENTTGSAVVSATDLSELVRIEIQTEVAQLERRGKRKASEYDESPDFAPPKKKNQKKKKKQENKEKKSAYRGRPRVDLNTPFEPIVEMLADLLSRF